MKFYKLIFLILMIISFITCKTQEDKTKKIVKKSKTDGLIVIGKLEELGFFNLTDKHKIEEVKKNMISSYEIHNYFGGITYEESLEYIDHRFHNIDQEELFELGGLIINLEKVKKTFTLMNLKLEYSNENNYEELSNSQNNYWKHTINLNQKEYIAFEGEMNDSWGNAMINFVTMLNDQLILQNSKEKIYLIYSGNDGMLVFLTPEMFEIVEQYYPNDYNRPMSVEQWVKFNKVKE